MKRKVETASKIPLVMLQPAVAATNCARAGKTTGLNIGWGACRWKKPCYGHARRDRCHKVPGRGKAVNDGPTAALSPGPGTRPSGREMRRVPDVVQRARGDAKHRSRCSAGPGPRANLIGAGPAAHRGACARAARS